MFFVVFIRYIHIIAVWILLISAFDDYDYPKTSMLQAYI